MSKIIVWLIVLEVRLRKLVRLVLSLNKLNFDAESDGFLFNEETGHYDITETEENINKLMRRW